MRPEYDTYMKSQAWWARREAMLELAAHCCEFCGANFEPLHVHHLTYERLGNEADKDLIVLCDSDVHEHPKFAQELRSFANGRAQVGPWGPDGYWRGRTP